MDNILKSIEIHRREGHEFSTNPEIIKFPMNKGIQELRHYTNKSIKRLTPRYSNWENFGYINLESLYGMDLYAFRNTNKLVDITFLIFVQQYNSLYFNLINNNEQQQLELRDLVRIIKMDSSVETDTNIKGDTQYRPNIFTNLRFFEIELDRWSPKDNLKSLYIKVGLQR